VILPERGSGLRIRNIPSALAVAAIITGALAGPVRAQLPPPPPDPMAISVGVAWVIPMGNLAGQDPLENTYYATSGAALTQRFSCSPLLRWGVFIQASFPAFGTDVAALDRDFVAVVVDGRNDITAWNLGIRWRGGKSWRVGPYAEAAIGTYRHRVETVKLVEDVQGEQELVRDSLVFPGDDTGKSGWATGWTGALGWVFPLTPAFALDAGLELHGFEAEFRYDPYVERWTNRWIGLRLLAVMTFGGKR